MYGLGRLPAIPVAMRGLGAWPLVARWRDESIRCLIDHAYRNVPFVRASLEDAGVQPRDVRGVADVGLLPVTCKRDIQEAGAARVVAKGLPIDRLIDRSTSGSTGERTLVKRTWFEERLLNAFRWRALLAYGLRPTERMAAFHFHVQQDPRDDQRMRLAVEQAGLFRTRVYDALADPHVAEAAAAFAPHVVSGMTSAIARAVEDCVSGGHPIRPRFVVTGGELLTEDLRARIAALGAPIRDLYGCNEANLIAWECPSPAGGYHVCDDAHVVEVLAPDGRPAAVGEWGEVVVTSLFSYAMPFIRYRVNDLAMRGPDGCSCGAPCSTLLAVKGRTIDCFPLASGRPLHPWEILNAIKPHMAWVKQFQMVQVALDAVEVRVVTYRAPTREELDRMAAAARHALAGRARVTITPVEAVEGGAAGKSRPFVPWSPP